jgi:type III pantothenate kinase
VTVLLVDIGNTRVKWARVEKGRRGRQQAAASSEWNTAMYASRLLGRARSSVERILVSSVAGSRIDRMLVAAARIAGVSAPEFVASQRSAAGVTTSYLEPWRLGVDRFVGVIGAHRLAGRRPACVVSVGTAITIDLVDGRGRHRGGAIVPGPTLMVDSLLKSTSGIRRRADGGADGIRSVFARTTRMAISQGARYAAAAVIDRVVAQARRELGLAPRVYLTGGAVGAIRPLLSCECLHVPDLVLRGLAVWGGLPSSAAV